jgi:hypothetical protein
MSWPHRGIAWPHRHDGEGSRKRRWYRNGQVIAMTAFSVAVVIAFVVTLALASKAPSPSTPTPPPTQIQLQVWDLHKYLNTPADPNARGDATYYPRGSSFISMLLPPSGP